MAITPTGPCEGFATVDDIPADSVCRQEESGGPGFTVREIEELIEAASDIVWVMLARPSVGICTATIYPVRKGGCWSWGGNRLMGAGEVCAPHQVRLDTPVVDITEVIVAGVTLDPSEYQLVDHCYLERRSGTWPVGSRRDVDAFSIEYQFGEPIPPLITESVVELVDELAKEIIGIPSVLPPNTTSVNRQGMSFSVKDQAERVRKTGPNLPKLYKALSIYNPGNERFPAVVLSPDDDYENHTVRLFS